MDYLMQSSHLQSDEFLIECEIRNIKGPLRSQIDQLDKQFSKEVEDSSIRPIRSHVTAIKTPRREISLCSSKLKEVQTALQEIITDDTNSQEFDVIISRLYHVQHRLQRISISKVVQASAEKFLKSCQLLLDLAIKIRGPQGNLSDSLEPLNAVVIEDVDELDTDSDSDLKLEQRSQKSEPTMITQSSSSNPNYSSEDVGQKYRQPSFKSVYANVVSTMHSLDMISSPQSRESTSQGTMVGSHLPATPSQTYQSPQLNRKSVRFEGYRVPLNKGTTSTAAQSYHTTSGKTFGQPQYSVQGSVNPNYYSQPPSQPNPNFCNSNIPNDRCGNMYTGQQAFTTSNFLQAGIPPQSTISAFTVPPLNNALNQNFHTPLLQYPTPYYKATQPINISKWNISFDGTSPDIAVEKFFFRVERLASTHGVSSQQLVHDLGFLLKGAAREQYWTVLEQNNICNWNELKDSFIHRFQFRRTDYDIRILIDNRKQKHPKESFIDFYYDIINLALPLKTIY